MKKAAESYLNQKVADVIAITVPSCFKNAYLSPVHDFMNRHVIDLHTYPDDNELYTSFNLPKGDQSDQLAAYQCISYCYDENP